MHWATKYIGIPFEYDGRTTSGWDCWGLVAAVFQKELGISLSQYLKIKAKDFVGVAKAIEAQAKSPVWEDVALKEHKPYDVILMKGSIKTAKKARYTIHCGIITDLGYIMHVEEGVHTVRLPITHLSLQSRIVRVCRHRSQLCII